jgi:hypothetical protein
MLSRSRMRSSRRRLWRSALAADGGQDGTTIVDLFGGCNGRLASICVDDGRFIYALERTNVETARSTEVGNPAVSRRPAAMPGRVPSNKNGFVYLLELVSRDVDDQTALFKPGV